MHITFHGAAGEVTGSQHLLEVEQRQILLDCGLFQGHRAEARLKNERFVYDPKQVDAVVLSHAHIDHCGNLPRLVRKGFRGPIFCTPATADVAAIMLQDAARIQAEDARFLSRHLKPGHPSVEPLYDQEDVERTVARFELLELGTRHPIDERLRIRFREAGHILGSAITELDVDDAGEWKRIVFSGDLGRRDSPLLRDPEPIERCDVLICESTYGDRVHPPVSNIKSELKRILHEAVKLGGRVIVPAFSLGRTQQLVYFLNDLFNSGELPPLPVFVDSPLSLRLTRVYRNHLQILDDDVQEVLQHDADPFGFPWLKYIQSIQESKALNEHEGPLMIISASGMCESGRIVHHLAQAVGEERNTIVLIGFQAVHTLGRKLAERRPYVKIFDREFALKAHGERLEGLSAHADIHDFRWWLEQNASRGGIGQAFLVHGEPTATQALAQLMEPYCDLPPIIPARGERFEV